MPVEKEMLERANRYWEAREQDVWKVAKENGLDEELEEFIIYTGCGIDEVLFDMFDNGDADLDKVDILAELQELLEEE